MNTIYEPGPITTLTLNRSGRRNAIDAVTAVEIAAAITRFAADDAAAVLVITGADGTFCAGADLDDTEGLGADVGVSGPLRFSALDPGKPSIAAIEGFCVAGGLELAAWCDLRIGAADATFGAYNRRWGIPFIDGGTVRIPHLVGLGNAMALLLGGLRYSATQMERMGFLQEVVAPGTALGRAHEIADWMASVPQRSLRADRASILACLGADLDEGLAREAAIGRPTLRDPELVAGIARFSRRDRPTPPSA